MKDLIAKLQMDAADQILATFTTLEMQLQGFAKSSYEKDLRIAELERELVEVRKDAERLNFIEAHPEKSLRFHKKHWSFVGFTNYEYDVFRTAREAVDSAILAAKEQA